VNTAEEECHHTGVGGLLFIVKGVGSYNMGFAGDIIENFIILKR
jgi:hypothetical protein